tara:strand:- start:1860 stop:2555 length:696 start_codon:yes stop_codon:yes gene_type:complete
MKIYSDGSGLEEITSLINGDLNIKGFTTNPSLMKALGVTDYVSYCKEFISLCEGLPVSFEVFADDFDEMRRQARIINGWGDNVYVKIPITNTLGESSLSLIADLQEEGIKVNITAVFTKDQIDRIHAVLNCQTPSVISVFAGRIADTGTTPTSNVKYAVHRFRNNPNAEVLWASCREIYNVYQAERLGCDIVTVQNSLLKKLSLRGKDLEQFSIDTVKMFRNDATNSGYEL